VSYHPAVVPPSSSQARARDLAMPVHHGPGTIVVSTLPPVGRQRVAMCRAKSHALPPPVCALRALSAREQRSCAGLALSWATSWARPHCACQVTARFWPIGQIYLGNSFLFHFGLNSNSNFENSYLPIQSSKIYEPIPLGS
jgi:hypothetical protein